MTALITLAHNAAATTPDEVLISDLDLGHVELAIATESMIIGFDEGVYIWSTWLDGELMTSGIHTTDDEAEKGMTEWVAEVTR